MRRRVTRIKRRSRIKRRRRRRRMKRRSRMKRKRMMKRRRQKKVDERRRKILTGGNSHKLPAPLFLNVEPSLLHIF